MSAKVHVVAPVFVVEDLAITWHQHGYGIREQQEPRCHRTGKPVERFVAHAGVFQLNGVHEVMQRDMGVSAAQAREQRRHQSAESYQRVAAESAEEKIEPDDVRFQPMQGPQQVNRTCGIIERPATQHVETLGLDVISGQFIGKNRKSEEWVSLQLLSDMKPIFT